MKKGSTLSWTNKQIMKNSEVDKERISTVLYLLKKEKTKKASNSSMLKTFTHFNNMVDKVIFLMNMAEDADYLT